MDIKTQDRDTEPRRYKNQGPKASLETWAILTVSVLEIALFALAFANLIVEPGLLGILKLAAISLLAAVVTYTINRKAISDGAKQAATGFWISGAASIISMMLVGTGLFISTYAGLVLKSVEEIRLAAHGDALARVITGRNKIAVEGNRPAALLRSIVSDLSQKRDCEVDRGCISGRSAGRGTVTLYLEEKIARAESIVGEKSTGETSRKAALVALNGFIATYRGVLADTSQDVWDRRLKLQEYHSKIEQKIALLDEAQPRTLLQAYAKELKDGVVISGRPQATARLNAIFKSHGEAMDNVLSAQSKGDETAPTFPTKTRVGETLGYLWEFLPIAMIVAVAELILPISLWVYAYIAHYWTLYRAENQGDEDDRHDPSQNDPDVTGGPARGPFEGREPNGDPIDGPYGYAGRWRFNEQQSDNDNSRDAPGGNHAR